jgi:hypothetical protein
MRISKILISLLLVALTQSFNPKTIYSRKDPRWAHEPFLGHPDIKIEDKEDIIKMELNSCIMTLLATSVQQMDVKCIDRECNPSQLNYLIQHNLPEINYLLNIKDSDSLTSFDSSILSLISTQIDENVHWFFITKPTKKAGERFLEGEYYNDAGLIINARPHTEEVDYVDSLGNKDRIKLDQIESLMWIAYNPKKK